MEKPENENDDWPQNVPLSEFRRDIPSWPAWVIVAVVGSLVVYVDIYELRHPMGPAQNQADTIPVADFRPLAWLPGPAPKGYKPVHFIRLRPEKKKSESAQNDKGAEKKKSPEKRKNHDG